MLGIYLFSAIASIFSVQGLAQEVSWVSGTYQGYEFEVEVWAENNATLTWADGTAGFQAVLNPNPSPRPRCPCDIFDEPDGRRLILERDLSGRTTYTSAIYQRNGAGGGDDASVRGTYQNYSFLVQVRLNRARLTWDDGTPGFTAHLNTNPQPRPRCFCEVFDGPDGRRLTLEKDFSGHYIVAYYARRF